MKCLAVLYALWLSVSPTLAAPAPAAPTTGAPAATMTIKTGQSLDIQVDGEAGLSKSYTVDAAGMISMEIIGLVRVVGHTPDQVAQDLRTRLARYLTRPAVNVTLGASASQEVMVTGEVMRPGPVKLRPGDGLLDVLGAAGGISPSGDPAHATLVRRGASQPLPLKLDLLMKGDLSQNVPLNDGDILQVPKKEIAYFQILGEVKQPGTKPIETPTRVLDALIAAGGLTDRADRNRVTLTRKNQPQPITIDLDRVIAGESSVNVLLQTDDVVSVGSRMIIAVGGEVKTPGPRLVRNGGTLMEAIAASGGFTPDADRTTVQVTHRDGITETFSLADVTTVVGGPMLKQEDGVIVAKVKPQFITVTGAVRNQGSMPFHNGLKVTDALMAASMLEVAKWKEVRVIRGSDGTDRKIMVFNLEEYLKKPEVVNLALQPGDQIFVAAQPRGHVSVLQRLLQVAPLANIFFNVATKFGL